MRSITAWKSKVSTTCAVANFLFSSVYTKHVKHLSRVWSAMLYTTYYMPRDRVPKSRPKVATCLMIGHFFIDQMVVLASDDKQNAINVSGNESKLENVYMGIKIVKNVFWTFVKFYILSINPSKWTFSTSAIENTILWSCKGSKKSDLYFLYIKYFTVSCGIYSLLKSGYFTHGWFRPK